MTTPNTEPIAWAYDQPLQVALQDDPPALEAITQQTIEVALQVMDRQGYKPASEVDVKTYPPNAPTSRVLADPKADEDDPDAEWVEVANPMMMILRWSVVKK